MFSTAVRSFPTIKLNRGALGGRPFRIQSVMRSPREIPSIVEKRKRLFNSWGRKNQDGVNGPDGRLGDVTYSTLSGCFMRMGQLEQITHTLGTRGMMMAAGQGNWLETPLPRDLVRFQSRLHECSIRITIS